jgi:hypothetical protein
MNLEFGEETAENQLNNQDRSYGRSDSSPLQSLFRLGFLSFASWLLGEKRSVQGFFSVARS